jgi:endogenous inhibitor of DNA gyrase (YacG/DUF329 family)
VAVSEVWREGVSERNTTCAGCSTQFEASAKQWQRSKGGTSGKMYCSADCQRRSQPGRSRIHPGVYGPCPTCGGMFKSKAPKKFCSLKCYQGSEQFKAHLLANYRKGNEAAMLKSGVPIKEPVQLKCLDCGKEWTAKPSQATRRFCSQSCYRSFMAKRFDRWIASPEKIALPQAYDEFLTQAELPCLIPGCSWSGGNLSNHMNFTHGVSADEFKRLAGFNKTTGVVSAPTRHALESRAHIHDALLPGPKGPVNGRRAPQSLESKEHGAKARLARSVVVICEKCGTEFVSSSGGRDRRFCSRKCFDSIWKAERKNLRFGLVCGMCGQPFLGSEQQNRSAQRGAPVFCGLACRQRNNSTSAVSK